MKRKLLGGGKKQLFTKRFFPAGNYTWVVPPGCTEVDVFLVGAGGPGGDASGAGGGYTKTFKKDTTGWRDGDTINVTPSESIPIVVGRGTSLNLDVVLTSVQGAYSQFKNTTYRAEGGWSGYRVGSTFHGGNGGSGGAARPYSAAGSDGESGNRPNSGTGQGHTTRDFGEATGKRNAGGGGAVTSAPGISDYSEGSGQGGYGVSGDAGQYSPGGSGYGGGAAGKGYAPNDYKGGDGTVLIRYWAYTE